MTDLNRHRETLIWLRDMPVITGGTRTPARVAMLREHTEEAASALRASGHADRADELLQIGLDGARPDIPAECERQLALIEKWL